CLKLNSDKTEVLILCSTPSAWNDSWWPMETDHTCNLSVILDSSLSMDRQVSTVSSGYFYTLRVLRKIYKWIPHEARRT
ncbi:hypothetical protein NDU88_005413, partial [Pleurodeles waltl]